jgi:hypothetical protein
MLIIYSASLQVVKAVLQTEIVRLMALEDVGYQGCCPARAFALYSAGAQSGCPNYLFFLLPR